MARLRPRHGHPVPRTGDIPSLSFGALVEVLCAVHLSSYVESPFADRGGLMIVGPPGVLKSTLIGFVDRTYPDAVGMSDINYRELGTLREQIAAKTIRTIVMADYQKVWERHPYTAANVEGALRALVGEGFKHPTFEDSRINQLRARCTFLSAMTPKFQVDHFKHWEESGFNRRFLWALVRLRDPKLLERAVEEWRLIDFRIAHIPPNPPNETLPNLTTREDRVMLRPLVKYQPGDSRVVQLALLAKVLSVLKWWYRANGKTERQAMQTVQAFGHTLGKEGAELVV